MNNKSEISYNSVQEVIDKLVYDNHQTITKIWQEWAIQQLEALTFFILGSAHENIKAYTEQQKVLAKLNCDTNDKDYIKVTTELFESIDISEMALNDKIELIDNLTSKNLSFHNDTFVFSDAEDSYIFNDEQWKSMFTDLLQNHFDLTNNPGSHFSYGAVLVGFFYRLSKINKAPRAKDFQIITKAINMMEHLTIAPTDAETLNTLLNNHQKQTREKSEAGRFDSHIQAIMRREQSLLDFISKEAKAKSLSKLKNNKVTTLAKKIEFRIQLHNDGKEANKCLYPFDHQALIKHLNKYHDFKTREDLPKNYVQILNAKKNAIAAG